MANLSENKGEMFELNKDLGKTNDASEHIDLENQLTQFTKTDAPIHFKNSIMNNIKMKESINHSYVILLAASLLIIALASFFSLMPSKETPKPTPLVVELKSPDQTGENISKIIGKEFGFNSSKTPKYYALYFTSTYCKPGIDFLTELDRFYIEEKSKNPDFEIIYIELGKHVHLINNPTELHFKKVAFIELQDKDFFKQFKDSHGPSFVVIDNNGKVVTKHKKNTHKNTFSVVLAEFSDLLAKS